MKSILITSFGLLVLYASCGPDTKVSAVFKDTHASESKTNNIYFRTYQIMDSIITGINVMSFCIPKDWKVVDRFYWDHSDIINPIRYEATFTDSINKAFLDFYPDVSGHFSQSPKGSQGIPAPHSLIQELRNWIKRIHNDIHYHIIFENSYPFHKRSPVDSLYLFFDRHQCKASIRIAYKINAVCIEEEYFSNLIIHKKSSSDRIGLYSANWSMQDRYRIKAPRKTFDDFKKRALVVVNSKTLGTQIEKLLHNRY